MGLRLHNTLTRTKQDFVPIDPANVRMYVCGPTVYDFAHIGNARPLIVFDVLFRLLRHLYGADHVTYVRNITDVDDKINARAAEEYPGLPLNEAIRQVTEETEKQFHDDVAALGCLPPTHEPRATEHIAEMRALVEALRAKDYAYVREDNVLFRVAAMKDYGRLSNRSLDEMIAGARVDVAPYKDDPMDFVLWKPSKPGEPGWPSPLGITAPGRPGWHLECSAMSDRWLWDEAKPLLSETGLARPHVFDIHGGGIDLIFPHHENEIAQSRSAHGTETMANYWLHNGFLQVEGEKMSKSLGNFVTIRDLMRGWMGEPWTGAAIRLAMLKSHYRQPMDWTRDRVDESKADIAVMTLETRPLSFSVRADGELAWTEEVEPSPAISEALEDDMNSSLATSYLLSKVQSVRSDAERRQVVHDIRFLGLFDLKKLEYLTGARSLSHVPADRSLAVSTLARDFAVASANNDPVFAGQLRTNLEKQGVHIDLATGGVHAAYVGIAEKTAETLVAARIAARKAKNFAEADRIRAELDAMGIALKDAKDPATGELVTTWEVKR